MRTLARFPDHGALTRLPVELSAESTAMRARAAAAPESAAPPCDPAEHDDSVIGLFGGCGDRANDGTTTVAAIVTADFDQNPEEDEEDVARPRASVGGHMAAFFVALLTPPRRRRPPKRIGWGSIAFLAMIAAGVWTLAWWQSREETKRPWEPVTRRMASQATSLDETLR